MPMCLRALIGKWKYGMFKNTTHLLLKTFKKIIVAVENFEYKVMLVIRELFVNTRVTGSIYTLVELCVEYKTSSKSLTIKALKT